MVNRAGTNAEDGLRAYNMRELSLVRERVGEQVLAWLAPHARVVLDVGCGGGQTLMALNGRQMLRRVGIDRDVVTLNSLRENDAGIFFVAAEGEALPIASASCDAVICRVALPYMNVTRALGEMSRVLRPGGQLYLSLHPARMVWGDLKRDTAALNWRGMVFRVFVLLNGFFFNNCGCQLRYPLNRSRQETFQSVRGIRKMLRAVKLSIVAIEDDRELIVFAEKIVESVEPLTSGCRHHCTPS